jgi:hypothetical protein
MYWRPSSSAHDLASCSETCRLFDPVTRFGGAATRGLIIGKNVGRGRQAFGKGGGGVTFILDEVDLIPNEGDDDALLSPCSQVL